MCRKRVLHEDEVWLDLDILDRLDMKHTPPPVCVLCGEYLYEGDKQFDMVDGVCDDCDRV